jgi:hypothetical protein
MKKIFITLFAASAFASGANAQIGGEDTYVKPDGNWVTHPGAEQAIFGNLINDARGTAGTAAAAQTGVNHAGGGKTYFYNHTNGAKAIKDGPLAPAPTSNYNAAGAAVRFYDLFTDNTDAVANVPSGTVVNTNGGSGAVNVEQEVSITSLHTFVNGKVWTPRTAWRHAFVHYDANGAAYTGAGAPNAASILQIDGYASKTGASAFTFPIGDGIYLRNSALSTPASGQYKSAYFAKNAPDNGTTGISGNAATTDGAANCNGNIRKVNRTEFWDIDGTAQSQFSLYALNSVAGYSNWGGAINFSTYTAADVVITGFDKWENLQITGTPTAFANDGAFTTTVATTPDPLYSAYTWAVAKVIKIKGTVFNDANGLIDGIVNGSPLNSSVGVPLYANLLDAAGNVVASVTVDPVTGLYEFPNAAFAAYTVQVSTNAGTPGSPAPADALPANWVATGENVGAGVGSDGTPNQRTPVTVTGPNDVVQVNFGLDRLPDTNPVLQTISQPSSNSLPLGTATQPLSGSDPEDGALGNANTIVITSIPTNATMLYNGLTVTAGTVITGFNPALLSYTGITTGSTSVSFGYAFRDAAGKQDPTPSTYKIQWPTPLPIVISSIGIAVVDCNPVIKWTTSLEQSSSRFEVERNTGGNIFEKIGEVAAAGNSATTLSYLFVDKTAKEGRNNYRLRLVDINGAAKYSAIVYTDNTCNSKRAYSVNPNPFTDNVTVNVYADNATKASIRLINSLGQVMVNKAVVLAKGQNAVNMPISNNLSKAMYVVQVVDENGVVLMNAKVIKK